MPFPLSVFLSNQGSFPPPALPGIPGTTSPSATLPARPAPRGVPVGVCAPPAGLPVLLPFPSSMRAAATTPAEPSGARVARFPAGGSLPRKTGGSASASYVSRPAQRSLALRPAWSLGRPWRPVPSECFRPCRCLHHPLRLLPAGATVAGRDSHPQGSGAFPRRTVSSVLHRHARGNRAIGERVPVMDRRPLEMPWGRQGYEKPRIAPENTLVPRSCCPPLSSPGVLERTPGYSRAGVGGACSGLRPVWSRNAEGRQDSQKSKKERRGNRSRRERRIGAVTALEWALSATLRRDEVSSAVTAASPATAAPTCPRLRRLPRRPLTAKPAPATRPMIAMATATTVIGASAVHRVVHDDRRNAVVGKRNELRHR